MHVWLVNNYKLAAQDKQVELELTQLLIFLNIIFKIIFLKRK